MMWINVCNCFLATLYHDMTISKSEDKKEIKREGEHDGRERETANVSMAILKNKIYFKIDDCALAESIDRLLMSK